MFLKFLRKKKKTNKKAYENIKRKILCFETKKGGLNMIRTQDQQKVFLTKWVIKYLDSQNIEVPEVSLTDSFFTGMGVGKSSHAVQILIHMNIKATL